jgi:nitroreductase
VPREVIEQVVACGLAAPSSKNAKPWRLHVVTQTSLLDEFADLTARAPSADTYVPRNPATGQPHTHWPSSVAESAAHLRDVPVGIFIENRGVFSGGFTTLRAAEPQALQNALFSFGLECMGLGAALENMWIGALGLGLSACFLGDIAIIDDTVADKLGMSGDFVGVLGIGYSSDQPFPARPSPPSTQVDDPVVWH